MRLTDMNKVFLVAVLVLTGMGSCKKFLDEKPQASASEEAVFLNSSSAYMALLGVYNQLAGDPAFGQRLSIIYPFDTDEMMGFPAGLDDQRRINSYDLTEGNTNLGSTFNQLYNGVERANVCILNIPKMPMYISGSETQKRELQRLHGEALTLRALFYSELIKLWGDVPAHYEPSALLGNYEVPKTDRDSIYDHILADLKTASELVPWRGEAGVSLDERITKGAVKALRARIALFRGGYSLRRQSKQMERRPDYLTYYTIAQTECMEIMARTDVHALNPSFEGIWRDNILASKVDGKEVLLEVAMAGENTDADSKVGSWNGIRVRNGTSDMGNYRNFVLPTHFYAFSPFDKRRDVSCAPFTITNPNYIGTSLYGIADGKWRRDWLTPAIPLNTGKTHYGINWPLIRYSDVLLMYAEAVNEITGPTTDAIDAVNRVRQRSFTVGALNTITVTNGGTGYTTIPTVAISGGGGTGATAVAKIAGGQITAIDIINPGANYSTSPTVTISGGGGSGATTISTRTTLTDANLTAAQTASKAEFFKAIVNERLLEFTSEGIRKYDLIRWNLLKTKIDETKAELVKMETRAAPYNNYPLRMYYKNASTSGLLWGNSFYTPSPAAAPAGGYTSVNWIEAITAALIRDKFAADFEPNKNELLPIPQSAIQTSHGAITQDYGY